jgi:uncharacterized protein with HEPN domain
LWTGGGATISDADLMLRFALVRAIEIIGEAASKLSPEMRAAAPSIHWPATVAMRKPIGPRLLRHRP